MTIPRLCALNKYFEINPPIHILLAGYVGYKPHKKNDDNPDDLLASLASAGFEVK